MALETATYLDGLDPLNPEFDDLVKEADDHMRLIKQTLQNTFPIADGAMPITGDGSSLFVVGSLDVSEAFTLAKTLQFTEQADHFYTPGAGFAQLWLNASGELIFTDAAGSDENLSGHMQAAPTPLVNEIGVFVDGNTIRGFAGFEWDGSSFTISDQVITGAASILYGPSDTLNWLLGRNSTTGGIILSADNGVGGGNVLMYGGSHASNAGDVHLRSATTDFLFWDQSLTNLTLTAAGIVTLSAPDVHVSADFNIPSEGKLYFDGGSNTYISEQSNNLNIFVGGSQHAGFSNAGLTLFGKTTTAPSLTGRAGFNIPEGVAPTTPADGDVWVTAAGEFFARLNGVSVDLTDSGVFTGSIADNQVAVGSGVDALEGTANLTFDGSNLDVTGSVTCDAFTSNGIDDNATVEKLNIADSNMDFGGASGQYTLRRGLTNSNLNITGGSLDSLGANIRLYGESAALFGNDMNLRAGLASFLVWDESAGELELFTGVGTTGGSKTLALTIDSSQNATFAGAVTVEGAFTSLGIDDNATGERLQIADTLLTLGASGASYEVRRSVTDQLLVVSGGNSSSGGTAVYYGGTHATLPGDLHLRSGTNSFLEWDESAGAYYIKTGIGAKTLALTINSTLLATFAGAVTVQGAFTSLGIDDNATAERMQISDTSMTLGAAGSNYTVSKPDSIYQLILTGAAVPSSGATIYMSGGSHASTPGDMSFASSNQTWMDWDESAGELTISTGVGTKTTALTIDSSQHATFAEKVIFDASTTADPSYNIPEGVAPTSPVDGDVWLTAAGEFFARLNGVSVDLATGGGPGGWNYTLQTGTSYTAVVGDFVAASNTGTVTITLPSGHSAGDEIIVKKTGASGTTTVDGNASETIDGATTFDLTTQYASLSIISDGTNWLIV